MVFQNKACAIFMDFLTNNNICNKTIAFLAFYLLIYSIMYSVAFIIVCNIILYFWRRNCKLKINYTWIWFSLTPLIRLRSNIVDCYYNYCIWSMNEFLQADSTYIFVFSQKQCKKYFDGKTDNISALFISAIKYDAVASICAKWI